VSFEKMRVGQDDDVRSIQSTIEMYDLAGKEDDRRISPFCWRIRLALAHKGLLVRSIPWRLTEKDVIGRFGATSVPVIVDHGQAVSDSWEIAVYLDKKYPSRPLFDSPQAKAYAFWFHNWTERSLHPLIVPLILEEVLLHLHEKDLAFFRLSRERAFGKPLEAVMDRTEVAFGRLEKALSPTRRTLAQNPFLAGEQPAYADYTLFGAFQWARCCSSQNLIRSKSDPIQAWLARMLDLYDGLARNTIGYPV
jgi:glutathione S-transferase